MLQIENLEFSYHKKKAPIFNGISLTIQPGSVYGLLGKNGIGKSTLLYMMCGLMFPHKGRITLDGVEVRHRRPETLEKIFLVPEEFDLPPISVDAYVRRNSVFYPRFDRSRFGELTDAFKLNPKANLGTFSKGMRRQAATVLALACKTDFLFLDETFDGLDPIMRNLYADVAERGATAVITSHSLRELEDTCDQLALLHKGGIVFESDVQNLKTTLFKVQIAFDHDYDHTLFSGFDVLNFTKHGSVSNLIVRGDRDKVVHDLRTKSPILMEVLPLSLEEVFLYEMESLGYSFGDELK